MQSFTEEEKMIVSAALKIIEEKVIFGASLNSPGVVRDYLRLKFGTCHNEIFAVIFLDTRHRVLALKEMFHGTIDSCSVHPRVVVQEALAWNAAAAILVHNHPSGQVDPSSSDRQITKRLKDALSLVDVRVLDHFVVGASETYSFTENGLL